MTDKEKSEELVKRIQAGERELMPELWEQINGLAKFWSSRYARALSTGNIDGNKREAFEDLYHGGYIAMCEAVKTYKPDSGSSFSSWFTYYFKQQLYKQRGWKWRLNKETGKGETHVTDALNTLYMSLNTPVDDSEDSAEFGEFIECSKATADLEEVERRIFNEQLRAALDECLATLPETEWEAITSSYYGGLTLREMADQAGVTIENIRQRQLKGMRKLRRGKGARSLRGFYCERWGIANSLPSSSDIYSAGLQRGNSTERAALNMLESKH